MNDHIIDTGAGHPIVFLHGTTMDKSMFEPQIKGLSQRYRTIAVDLRARRENYASPYSLADLVSDTVQLLDQLTLRTCTLVGMSMGGFTAIEFALTHPDRLDALILIDTMADSYTTQEQADFNVEFAKLDIDGTLPEDFAEWTADLCFGPTTRQQNPQLVDHWISKWVRLPARSVYREAGSWIGKQNRTTNLAEIIAPTLVIHGEEDVVLQYDRAALPLAAGIPNCRLAPIPGAGHTSNLEAPDFVTRQMEAFLAEVYR